MKPGAGWISFPFFRHHAGSWPWGRADARHFSDLPSILRRGSLSEIYRSANMQLPQPRQGSSVVRPGQSDRGTIEIISGPSEVEARQSGAITTQDAATSQSFRPVFGAARMPTPQGLSLTGSRGGSTPLNLFRYHADGTFKTAGPASHEPEASRSGAIVAKVVTASRLPGLVFGGVQRATPRMGSRISPKEGWISFPLFRHHAASLPSGGHSAANSSTIPPVPVKISRHEIPQSTHTEQPQPRPDRFRDADKAQEPAESFPSERPLGLPQPWSQGHRRQAPSSQAYEARPRDPVLFEAQGTNRPLVTADVTIGSAPTVYRSPAPARPGSQEISLRGIGGAAVSRVKAVARAILFPLTSRGVIRSGRQTTAANAATDLVSGSQTFNPVVSGPRRILSTGVTKSPVQPMLSSILLKDRHGDEVLSPGAGYSEWLAVPPVIGPTPSVFAFPAPRAAMLSRFVEPSRDAGFLSPDSTSVLTTPAFESNRVPSVQSFPARLGSIAVPHAEAPLVLGRQRSVLNFTGLGSQGASGSQHDRSDGLFRLPPPASHIVQPPVSFPVHRAAEVTGLPWSKTRTSALVESQSSIVNRQSSIKMRTMLPYVPTQDPGHSGRVDPHRMTPVRSSTAAEAGPMFLSPGDHVFASRASRIAQAPGSSIFHTSAVPASFISLRGTQTLARLGEEPHWYSGPDLPLASAVQRSTGHGRGEPAQAESPGVPGSPGDQVLRAISLPGGEVSTEGQVTAPAQPAPPATGVDMEELFDRVVRRLLRELANERERRGFTPWL
jgi:hypothetical protein